MEKSKLIAIIEELQRAQKQWYEMEENHSSQQQAYHRGYIHALMDLQCKIDKI